MFVIFGFRNVKSLRITLYFNGGATFFCRAVLFHHTTLYDWFYNRDGLCLLRGTDLACTGLFKMIVGVLTTCHTQYTRDRSM
jgi:hypothetical protein